MFRDSLDRLHNRSQSADTPLNRPCAASFGRSPRLALVHFAFRPPPVPVLSPTLSPTPKS